MQAQIEPEFWSTLNSKSAPVLRAQSADTYTHILLSVGGVILSCFFIFLLISVGKAIFISKIHQVWTWPQSVPIIFANFSRHSDMSDVLIGGDPDAKTHTDRQY